MSSRSIIGLAILLAALAGIYFIGESRQAARKPGDGELFLPGLKDTAGALEEIKITKSGNSSVATIARSGDAWLVRERDDYPADTTKLGNVVQALADARRVEQKTAKPELYGRLGVDSVENESATGVEIQFAGTDFRHTVILGDEAQGNYRYARVADAESSWLIDRNPDISTETGDWLEDDLVDIAADRVSSITIKHPDGEIIRLRKEDTGSTDFLVDNIPEGRELRYPSIGNGVGSALAALKLTDARKARESETPTESVVTTHQTVDGLAIATSAVSDGDDTWLSFVASVSPGAGSDETGPDSSTGADDQHEGASADPEKEAEEINTKLSGWQYRVASHKADNLTRRWDDLLASVAE